MKKNYTSFEFENIYLKIGIKITKQSKKLIYTHFLLFLYTSISVLYFDCILCFKTSIDFLIYLFFGIKLKLYLKMSIKNK